MEAPKPVAAREPLRVMVVDDSAVIRGFLTRFIEEDPDLKVVLSMANGQMAVNALEKSKIDVAVLDIEMPVMDGLTAIPLLLQKDPSLQIIVASTLTKENAAITMRCLQAGAAECLAKPTSHELAGAGDFKRSLIDKVKTLGHVTTRKRATSPLASAAVSALDKLKPVTPPAAVKKFSLRQEIVKSRPEVIAIGSSTGGPQALMQFFSDLKTPVRQPVFVTQHMPPTFTTILAEHISKQTGLVCKEGVEGEAVVGGRIYLAPGNFHMTVKVVNGAKVIALNQDAPENFCRPAVDPMLRSIVDAYGKRVLAVILTGMGSDGAKGCQKVAEVGGTVLAQDEATSVVWGMPGATAMSGACNQVLPLGLMARAVRDYADLTG